MEDTKTYTAIVFPSKASESVTGVCNMVIDSKTIELTELEDNCHFDKVKNVINQLSTDICIIFNGNDDCAELENVFKNEKVEYHFTDLTFNHQDLKKRIQAIAAAKTGLENVYKLKFALLAFNSLCEYLKLDMDVYCNQFFVKYMNLDLYVEVDSQTLWGLDIFSVGNDMSLFKALNRTRTAGGERLLRTWLKQPLKDVKGIIERQNVVEAFVVNADIRQTIYNELLRKLPDLENLSMKLLKKKIGLSELYKIYQGVNEVKKINMSLEKSSESNAIFGPSFVEPLNVYVTKMSGFQAMITSSLDFTSIEKGELWIKSSFDEDLLEIKNELDSIQKDIDSTVFVVAQNLGLEVNKSLKLEWTSNHGHYFRISLKDEILLRKKKGYIIIDSVKSGIKFRSETLTRMNSNYLELKEKYDKKQERIVEEIIDISTGYGKFIDSIGKIASKLDVLVSFAIAALSAPIPYVKPTVIPMECSQLMLKSMRHPCLELLSNVTFIPNDAIFEKFQKFHILTGPNLGGKSTFMRSVALNVLMAQIGSFVPCSEAEISIIDKVLVRIGAGDRQLEGVSTFMAEMLEASHIIRSATPYSLILIDEIGRGTSTFDGLGIAWSLADKIAKEICCFTIFATHFFELTKLSSVYESVTNFHMAAMMNEDKFTLLYQVQADKSEKSFGVEVAKAANFPSNIIANAQDRLKTYERSAIVSKVLELTPEHYSAMRALVAEWDKNGNLEELKEKVRAAKIWDVIFDFV